MIWINYNEGWLRDNYPKMTLQSYISLVVNFYDLSIQINHGRGKNCLFFFPPGVMAQWQLQIHRSKSKP